MTKKLIKYSLDTQTKSIPIYILIGGMVPNYVTDQGYPEDSIYVGITIDNPGNVGLQTFNSEQELQDYLITFTPYNFNPNPNQNRMLGVPPVVYDPITNAKKIWDLYIAS